MRYYIILTFHIDFWADNIKDKLKIGPHALKFQVFVQTPTKKYDYEIEGGYRLPSRVIRFNVVPGHPAAFAIQELPDSVRVAVPFDIPIIFYDSARNEAALSPESGINASLFDPG